MATNLFAQGGGGGNANLAQFRAGKMTLEGGIVTADKRKGLVQLTSENGAVIFKWTDRATNRLEDSFFLLPGQATFQKVPQCADGRVFLLNFLDCNRQVFFWMQEPNAEKDADHALAVSKALGSTGAAAPATAGRGAARGRGGVGGRGGRGGATEMATLQALLGTPATPAPATTNPSSGAQLMQLLGGAQSQRRTDASLTQLLAGSEVLAAIKEDPEYYMSVVAPTLPTPAGASNVVEQVRNPQMGSTASMLQEALRDPSGFRELCTAFNVQVPAGATPSVEDFLDAIAKEKPN